MGTFATRDFSSALELWGSGVRKFSPIDTADFDLTRNYIQRASTYKPIAISTVDYQYKGAYLVDEYETKRDGYAVWFTRVYSTVPSSRTESREVAFVFPGSSGLIIASNGKVGGWSKYGFAQPIAATRAASVTISYSLGQVSVNTPTTILYNGQPVDFAGVVYTDDGQKILGTTTPISRPSSYVISDVCRRWKGDIWEREQVTIGGPGTLMT